MIDGKFSITGNENCKIQEIKDVSGVCSFELAEEQQKGLNK